MARTEQLIQRIQNACDRFSFPILPRVHGTPFIHNAKILLFDVINSRKPECVCKNQNGSKTAIRNFKLNKKYIFFYTLTNYGQHSRSKTHQLHPLLSPYVYLSVVCRLFLFQLMFSIFIFFIINFSYLALCCFMCGLLFMRLVFISMLTIVGIIMV